MSEGRITSSAGTRSADLRLSAPASVCRRALCGRPSWCGDWPLLAGLRGACAETAMTSG